MFHIELRRFPHVARAFNLAEDQLQARIVLPWVRGASIELDDRRWSADRTRLTIYEAPELAPEDRGLGRGWANVTRDGEDVTDRLLEAARRQIRESSPEASIPQLKRALLSAAAAKRLTLPEAVALVEQPAGRRASERLALTERAVWELLHEGRLTLLQGHSELPVPAEQWRSLLLAWEAWTDPVSQVRLRAASAPPER